MGFDEAELVARSQDGDLAAFNRIVERYQGQVYNVAARITGNRTSAEDVAQETFTSAYRSIRRFRGLRSRSMSICSIPPSSLPPMRSPPSRKRCPTSWPERSSGRSWLPRRTSARCWC